MKKLNKILAVALSIMFLAHPIAMAKGNKMGEANSLYLQLHKDNPINWYEWGPEALAKAKKEGKPLFISIGYFSCHWCHVMNEETFHDPEVGKMLNKYFISIKIDRQERPDLDRLYMTYLNMTTGRGGWPMTIFATPEGTPFFGGTFYPSRDGMRGMPGLLTLGPKAAEIFRNKKDVIASNTVAVKQAFERLNSLKPANALDDTLPQKAIEEFRSAYNKETGGFGDAPKFPQETNLQFIMEYEKNSQADLKMLKLTLDKMAGGGMYDQIGGGFHRYSVDAEWGIPHFEKMLYTNAAMLRLYTAMYRLTKEDKYLDIANDIGRYGVREMYRPGGGFWSAQDADDPKGEGEYYSWTKKELIDILGKDDGLLIAKHFGIEEKGNFTEDKSVPRVAVSLSDLAREKKTPLKAMRKKIDDIKNRLYNVRLKRPAPALEKQVLASWSAMMARGYIDLYTVTGKEKDLVVARKTMGFIEKKMTVDGELRHSYMNDILSDETYLEDYSLVIAAYIDLFEATQDMAYLKKAEGHVKKTIELFGDDKNGGFYMSATHLATPIVRQKAYFDNATPSGAAMMAMSLLRLYALTGDKNHFDQAVLTLRSGSEYTRMSSMMVATYLRALSAEVNGVREFALVGKGDDPAVKQALNEILRAPVFTRVALLIDHEKPESVPDVHKDKSQIGDEPTLYLCRNFACDTPVAGLKEIRKVINKEAKKIE